MTNNDGLARRQFLQRLAAITGGALSAPIVSAILAGAPSHAADKALTLLGDSDLELLAAIADTIIPDTDTPGARAAGVHHYMHLMLSEWYSETERQPMLAGLAEIDQTAQAATGETFANSPADQQIAILQKFDMAVFTSGGNHFFKAVKEMVIVGYYTSEIGASEELRYEPVPGPYQGCVPFSQIGRTWAT
ncbi:MAG: gluconate 2-dehydrogenase subunit 3 family protein [Kordiimonadaceae bacterium]|nr:gluconate 2-dehydrogenase subunit 3 family protein [Kordiimonadaceae bacterium]